MQKRTTGFIVFIALLVVGMWWYQAQESVDQSTLSPDLYPLYEAVEWGVPRVEEVAFGTTTLSGVEIVSHAVKNTMNPASVFMPFEEYYTEKLAALGWEVDTQLAAGGPMGGQTGYRKGEDIIFTRFNTLFHIVSDTAPSECPCDVTLSLFSTGL